jgi:hypothetical protein
VRRRAAAAHTAALLGAALLAGTCTERPDAPARDNPLDPGNPATGGDPFHLEANASHGVVVLTWDAVPISGSVGYSVYRSRAPESLAIAPDTLDESLTATTYSDTTPLHDATSYYVVTVRNALGQESLRSAAAGVRLDLPPLLLARVPGCAACATTDRRDIEVVVFAEDADSVHLASAIDTTGLVDPVSFPYTGDPIPWTLPASASEDDVVKPVHGRVRRADGSFTAIVSDSIEVTPITLHLAVDGQPDGPVITGRRSVALAFRRAPADSQAPAGVESIEVWLSPTPPGAWTPFVAADTLTLADAALDTIHARVKNAFGLEARDSVAVGGDSLLDAAILLNNSEFPIEAPSTGACRVNVHVENGRVLRICLSKTPIPPCPAFEDLSGFRAGFALDAADVGTTARVYAILANEWRPEGGAVIFDDIDVRDAPLSVAFRTPTGGPSSGSYVQGADSTLVGVARGRTCATTIQSVLVVAGTDTLGPAALEPAAPSDSMDVVWRLVWRVSGPVGALELTALAIDTAQDSAEAAVLVSIEPAPGAGKRSASW